MQISIQSPRKFLNALLSQKSIIASEFEVFKAALVKYTQDVQQQKESKQSEPNIVAGALMPFLQAKPLAYNCRPHSQKGQSGIDLAILTGNDVAVIIEAKVVGSKDMITAHDLNRKAFHEAIFYFMQEREKGNVKLTHIVITDFYEWFVFDAQDFDRLFWRNDQLKKAFHAYHNPNLLTKTTADVYAVIEAELPKMLKDLYTEVAIDCAYFNVAAPHSINDKELIAIYKLLSPDCLLKKFNPNDANSLNREFYNELLYILGLEEVKDGGKRLISAAGTAGSFYVGIADKLDQQGKPHAFEDVIKLIIIWINRVLFLKLLESQIVTWTGDKTSRFLSADKISGYDGLENLFFDTLARRVPDRTNKSFAYIPYLNSSLFEMQDEEKSGIGISALSDSTQIAYYPKTVVKDAAKKRKSGKINTLAYLFEFLDAYDFANDSGDEVVAETKNLISASVLGLIFEKINGYKDGSFYTPSFVTMYMARQTIEKAVLQKFNEKYGWACTALTGDGGLKNEIKDHKVKKQESNALIDSLKICDPAVGSGHFLVSALNEILYIKSVLGLLVDEAGNLLGYDISIENDELIVTSDEGELFEYKKGSKEKTRIQKTLFQEKQKIIENCLFGVDINPNSVNICRLRLWIELLKNAYYQPDGALETLPNIDINIKCGNSLISRFALDTDLKGALKKSKITVDEYRTAVSNYRNTSDKAEKRQIEALIERIKSNFRTEIQYYDPKQKRLEDLPKLIRALDASQSLLGETEKEEKERKQKQAKLRAELAKLSMEVNDIKNNIIYKNAFEWRFEFPEVMDAEGKFIGFDVIIGNPPYIFTREMISSEDKSYFNKNYKLTQFKINLYFLFVEKSWSLLDSQGIFSFIVPNNWLTLATASDFRYFVLTQAKDICIANSKDNVFENASVDTSILTFRKTGNQTSEFYDIENGDFNFIKKINPEVFVKNKNHLINYHQNESKEYSSLFKKIVFGSVQLDSIAEVRNGIQAYTVGEGEPVLTEDMKKRRIYHNTIKLDNNWLKYVDGVDVSRYDFGWSGQYVKYGSNLSRSRKKEYFVNDRLLVRQIPAKPPYSILACFVSEIVVNDNNSMIIVNEKNDYDLKYILAIINSRLISFWFLNTYGKLQRNIFPQFKVKELREFPIKQIDKVAQQPLIDKVNAMMTAKQSGQDTLKLEQTIDDMVYRLYGLTYDEVKTIEPDYSSLSRDEYEAGV